MKRALKKYKRLNSGSRQPIIHAQQHGEDTAEGAGLPKFTHVTRRSFKRKSR